MRRVLVFICMVASFYQLHALAGVQYIVVDLGTLGGSYSDARGINNSGQIVGFADHPALNTDRAFRTLPNAAINPTTDELGTLGGTYSYALSINDVGQVTGYAATPLDYASHAYRTAANSPINSATDDLGTLSATPMFSYSQANAINASGQVVGVSDTTSAPYWPADPFRTASAGAMSITDSLQGLGGLYGEAMGVNSSGTTVGYSDISPIYGASHHAFRVSATGTIRPVINDLGTLGGSNSYAADINTSGQTVGAAQITGDTAYHAFRIAANASITAASDLGTLGGANSKATAINDNGWVVGVSEAADAQEHAFLYDGTSLQDLNGLIDPTSGWMLKVARDINTSGQIVGTGILNGKTRGFLLIPVSMGLPVVTTQPQEQALCSGTAPNVVFTITATGPDVLTYTWMKNNTLLSDDGHYVGTSTPTLTINNPSFSDSGSYRCKVSNANGTVYSNAAMFYAGTPTIGTQPQSVYVCPGTAVSFTVGATNATSYLWEISDDNGETWKSAPGVNNTSIYNLDSVASSDKDTLIRAKALNGPCSSISESATIGVRAVRADFNEDCHVDATDWLHFEACGTGPSLSPQSGCENADLDKDGDVDNVDFGIFQRCYTDVTLIADPACQN